MRQEEQRVKAIKLLSLDLEKTDLELKQKEVQVKLAQLNKANVGESLGTGAPMPDKSVFIKRLTALTVTEDFKEAVLDINGVPITVHEGDSIIDGKVLHIDAQGVMLAYPSGKQEQLSLNL